MQAVPRVKRLKKKKEESNAGRASIGMGAPYFESDPGPGQRIRRVKIWTTKQHFCPQTNCSFAAKGVSMVPPRLALTDQLWKTVALPNKVPPGAPQSTVIPNRSTSTDLCTAALGCVFVLSPVSLYTDIDVCLPGKVACQRLPNT